MLAQKISWLHTFLVRFAQALSYNLGKEEKTAPRSALTVNLCNISFKKETGCAFYGVRGRCALPEPPSKATKSLRRRYAPQNSRVQFVAPQGLTPLEFVLQRLSLIPARAFSVAEVAIALLIGSIILGMAAPMITKQLKNEKTQYVQIEILKKY